LANPAARVFRQGPPAGENTTVTGQVGETLKLSIVPPSADGNANDACIDFFAKLLHVSRSSVTIASAQSSRNKVIRIAGISAEEVRNRIGS
jgi:uncharacterized protein